MNVPSAASANQPRLIPSLVAGFNFVASHAYLLLFPLILDGFLWFGPHFRLKNLTEPLLNTVGNLPAEMIGDSGIQKAVVDLYRLFFEHFNLASLLSTLPVGIPSLMASVQPLESPLGKPPIYEVNGVGQLLSGWLLFVLVGLALGSVFFHLVSEAGAKRGTQLYSLQLWLRQYLQVLLLTLLLVLILLIVAIPMFLFTFVLMATVPALAQFGVLFGMLAMVWVLVPLLFSPHGIMALRLNALQAMYASMRTVRMHFPSVTLLVLIAVVLSQGLGVIWRMAPPTSWLALGGIFGNAFIYTSILAGSFIYYRAAAEWAAQPKA